MSGYRRVSFYELCRLCTTNEGVKVPIFNEEGRNRQLPTKIQVCLRVQINEKDTLPKHICDICLEKLEGYFDFRTSCVSAEVMLQSYASALQNNEDFRRDGTVYIKDIHLNAGSDQLSKFQFSSGKGESDEELYAIKLKNQTCNTIGSLANLNSLVEAATSIRILPEDPSNTETVEEAYFEKTTVEHNYSNKTKYFQSSKKGLNSKVDLITKRIEDEVIPKAEQLIVETYTPQVEPTQVETTQVEPTSHRTPTIPDERISKDERDTSTIKVADLLERSPQNNLIEDMDANHYDQSIKDSENTYKTSRSESCSGDVFEQKPNEFFCSTCLKRFKRKEHLNQHIKSHSVERPFVCPKCSRSFHRKEHLVRHVLSHTGQKEYGCDICYKTFSRKDNVRKHRKTHEPSGPYTCEFCGKEFVVKTYYTMHRNTHIANGDSCKELPFNCYVCQKPFASKELMHQHVKRHKPTKNVNYAEDDKSLDTDGQMSDSSVASKIDNEMKTDNSSIIATYAKVSILEQTLKQDG